MRSSIARDRRSSWNAPQASSCPGSDTSRQRQCSAGRGARRSGSGSRAKSPPRHLSRDAVAVRGQRGSTRCAGTRHRCRRMPPHRRPASAEGASRGMEFAVAQAAFRLLHDVQDEAYVYFTHSPAPVTEECTATTTTARHSPRLSKRSRIRRAVSSGEVLGGGLARPSELRPAAGCSARRIIACLDVRDGRVVKGINFGHLGGR